MASSTVLSEYKQTFLGRTCSINCDRSIEVYTLVNVHDIEQIDSQKEQFSAVFTLNMFWTDPSLRDFQSKLTMLTKGVLSEKRPVIRKQGVILHRRPDLLLLKDSSKEDFESDQVVRLRPWEVSKEEQPLWENHFEPKFSFLNAVEVKPLFKEKRLEYVSKAGGFVSCKVKYQGTFNEKLELQRFPFDRQLCVIKISAEMAAEYFQFVALENKRNNRYPCKERVANEEWEIDETMQRACTMYVRPLSSDFHGFKQLSNMHVVLHVQRRPDFFLDNVVTMLFIICCTSVSAFGVKLSEFGDRLAVQVTYFLSLVLYKHLVSTWIPRKPYKTLLDKYILYNFLFIALCILEGTALVFIDFKEVSASCGGCLDSVDVDGIDSWFCKWLYGLWVAVHLVLRPCARAFWRPDWTQVYQNNREPFHEEKVCRCCGKQYDMEHPDWRCTNDCRDSWNGRGTLDIRYRTPLEAVAKAAAFPRRTEQLKTEHQFDNRILDALTSEERSHFLALDGSDVSHFFEESQSAGGQIREGSNEGLEDCINSLKCTIETLQVNPGLEACLSELGTYMKEANSCLLGVLTQHVQNTPARAAPSRALPMTKEYVPDPRLPTTDAGESKRRQDEISCDPRSLGRAHQKEKSSVTFSDQQDDRRSTLRSRELGKHQLDNLAHPHESRGDKTLCFEESHGGEDIEQQKNQEVGLLQAGHNESGASNAKSKASNAKSKPWGWDSLPSPRSRISSRWPPDHRDER